MVVITTGAGPHLHAMRLQGIHGGRVYATSYDRLLVETSEGFEVVGRLPVPEGGVAGLGFRATRVYPWKALLERAVGAFAAVTVRQLDDAAFLATAGRWLFASSDGGRNWAAGPVLSPSSGLAGVLPSGICVHDGAVYLGEYPLDDEATPRVLRSTDAGRTWEAVLELPEVRHVHSVSADPYSGELWVTTGDRDEECLIGRLRDGELEVVVGGSQRFRAVEPVFVPDGLLWGMDCGYAETNRVFRLARSEFDAADPSPEAVAAVPNSVYWGESLRVGGDRWAVFSTGAETGRDSTAADRSISASSRAEVIAASSASGFSEWHTLASFRRRRSPADRLLPGSVVPSANAYVYLASDPERGLLVNPYNTERRHGEVIAVPPERFESLAREAVPA